MFATESPPFERSETPVARSRYSALPSTEVNPRKSAKYGLLDVAPRDLEWWEVCGSKAASFQFLGGLNRCASQRLPKSQNRLTLVTPLHKTIFVPSRTQRAWEIADFLKPQAFSNKLTGDA
ncbi:hypothetical protein FM036_45195 [Nostoc sp. HG1]|nr:hypothetical protein [Nostoc sp. HG1]